MERGVVEPVSYTHLDVYKRQKHMWAVSRLTQVIIKKYIFVKHQGNY